MYTRTKSDLVVFVTHQLMVGGVENVFLNIAKSLCDKKIVLVTVRDVYDPELIAELPPNVTLFKKRRPVSNQSVFSLFRTWLDVSISIDLSNAIVVNFSDTLSSLVLSFLLNGRRKISWIHCNPNALKHSRSYRLYLFLLNKFNGVICLCEKQKNLLISLSLSLCDKVTICTNMVNVERIQSLGDAELELPFKSGGYILMVARFDSRSKDFATIIDAYARLDTSIRDVYKLVLLGDGPDFESVSRSVSKGFLKNHIFLPGSTMNPYKWMKNASLLVHSSKSEGFPLVLLEAMICGVPIISSNCDTGPSDMLADGYFGVLFPVGDVDALADSINRVLKNKGECSRLGRLSIQRGIELTKIGKQQIRAIFND